MVTNHASNASFLYSAQRFGTLSVQMLERLLSKWVTFINVEYRPRHPLGNVLHRTHRTIAANMLNLYCF